MKRPALPDGRKSSGLDPFVVPCVMAMTVEVSAGVYGRCNQTGTNRKVAQTATHSVSPQVERARKPQSKTDTKEEL